jgi:hypothetical protein
LSLIVAAGLAQTPRPLTLRGETIVDLVREARRTTSGSGDLARQHGEIGTLIAIEAFVAGSRRGGASYDAMTYAARTYEMVKNS